MQNKILNINSLYYKIFMYDYYYYYLYITLLSLTKSMIDMQNIII